MQKIDTEYKSLSEIDPEITRFYAEDKRTHIVEYVENDEGISEPVEEEITVIVLNKPDEVYYDYVESRRSRRHNDGVIKQALVQATLWEDFDVNHDAYLYWLEEYRTWEIERPTEIIDDEEVPVAAPERPVIDMSVRRAHYFVNDVKGDDSTHHTLPEFSLSYDDLNFVTTKTYALKKKTKKELDAEMDCKRHCEARAYLLATDYITARIAEGGDPMPDDVKAKRAKAREVLNNSYVEPEISSFYP